MKASPESIELLGRLQEISLAGPIPAVGTGATTIGMTLLDALDVEYSSTRKPSYKGIVITARRGEPNVRGNRVNLFARVPDWNISTCTSSAEIVDTYGYLSKDGRRKLYCTVSAKRPNTQGLMLQVDEAMNLLDEVHVDGSVKTSVASWRLDDLTARLAKSHPESVWVSARSREISGREHFHYNFVIYTARPQLSQFGALLREGTITVDHLIDRQDKKVNEKGPLFKIDPSNFELLFGRPLKIDLMTIDLSSLDVS
jgi:hypothetical protein